jgi:hypothetical protein
MDLIFYDYNTKQKIAWWLKYPETPSKESHVDIFGEEYIVIYVCYKSNREVHIVVNKV